MRRFVIGDIHGCSKALRTLIETLAPQSDDQLIFLGDLIDRGPDSRGVIDQMLAIGKSARMVVLRGNHEMMLMGILFGGCDPSIWLKGGGAATVASYGGSLEKIPVSHKDFFRSTQAHFETERELFIHAGYHPELPLDMIEDEDRYWKHLTEVPAPHCSGKRVFVGHTPQPGGRVLDYGHVVLMDTYCFGGGWLSAMDLDSDEVYQVSRHGHARRTFTGSLSRLFLRWMSGRLKQRTSQVNGMLIKPMTTGAVKCDWRSGCVINNGSSP
jgi:serine/threonine protein phosphatase 1